MTDKTAVIILNWNGEKLLREFLPSVVEHTSTTIATVIVADNGSTDGSLQLLATEFPQVEVMAFDKNYGFAEGYNRAIKACSNYKYCLLLNSDVEVSHDWLEPLFHYMENHPETGACQPKIRSYRDKSMYEYAGACGGYIDRNGYPYCRGRLFATVECDNGQYDTPANIFWASGAALMVRTDLYIAAGGLDADFFAHMEEIDLCWRIQLMGHKIAAVPQSTVYHLGGGSLDASNPQKTYLNFRNNLLMLHKNLPDSSRKATLIKRRLLDTLAWCKFMATLDFKNARAIWKAHRDFASMRRNYTSHPATDLLHTTPRRPNILTSYYLRGRRLWSQL